MPQDIPLTLLVPVGAILAACITGAISFIALVLAKEQKISEFRQAWIDALRSELSEFASQARRISTEKSRFNFKEICGTLSEQLEARNEEVSRPDPFHENRQKLAQAYYLLRLRLNPDEPDNQKILNHLDNTYKILNERAGSVRYDEVIQELDTLAHVSQVVLKSEWSRVKCGETTFKATTRTAKIGAILLGFLLTLLICYSIFVTANP